MVKKHIAVLHIDTETYWRGGQQQAVYLHEGMLRAGLKSLLLCPPSSKTEQVCNEKGLPAAVLKMRNEADVIAALKISSIVKKKQIPVIVAHTAKALSLSMLAAKRNKSCKLIAVRRVDFHVAKNRLSRWKYSTNLLTKIVAVSDAIKKVLIEDGIAAEKITVIHSGIDLQKYTRVEVSKNLRKALKIPENKFIVGTVAALVGHKDYPNLLRAAEIVLRKREDVVFIALGSGADEGKLKRLHTELNLGDNFIFAGFREEPGKFFRIFDAFVLASKTEGLGTSILDAMALGLPVIATDAGGIPEIVKDNKTGLLVEKQNPQALAEAILKMAGDKLLRERLSAEGRRLAERFSVENVVKRYISLFDEIGV